MTEIIGKRIREISAISQFSSTIQPRPDYYPQFSGQQAPYQAFCFGDARAIASGIEFLAIKDDAARESFLAEKSEAALAASESDLLWRAVSYHSWTRNVYSNTGTPPAGFEERIVKCLEKLVAMNDSEAAANLVNRLYSKRMSSSRNERGEPIMPEPMEKGELEGILELKKIARNENDRRFGYQDRWLMTELNRTGMHDEADAIIQKILDNSSEPSATISLAFSMLQYSKIDPDESDESKIAARERAAKQNRLILDLLKTTFEESNPASISVQYFSSAIPQMIPGMVEAGALQESIELAELVLPFQARSTAAMRPSQRDRQQSNSAPTTYYYSLNSSRQNDVVNFPPSSSYFEAYSITTLHSLYESAKRENKTESVIAAIGKWVEAESDEPFEKYVRLMSRACIEYWSERRVDAMKTFEEISKPSIGPQTVALLQIRTKYDSGDVRGALELVDALRPANQNMMVDRELTRLQLVLQLGDLELARTSARKLFALRLDYETEFKLAELMNQLGMKEMGDRMMDRIRRKAGGKQETLSNLMQSYASAGDMDAACEIARQVLRRSRPARSRNYQTSENTQNEQALQILVRAGQISPMIEQYEKLVERSPKAVQLVEQLAAFYDAAGRRAEAQKIRIAAAGNSPSDPKSLFNAGQAFAASGDNEKAVEKYIDAIRKSPEMLNNNYYEMQTAFNATRGWNKLIDMMSEEGLDKFASSYRMSEIAGNLIQNKEYETANKMFRAILQKGDLLSVSRTLSDSSRSPDFKIDNDIAKMIVDKLCDSSGSLVQARFVSSYRNGGLATGTANHFIDLVRSNESEAERLVAGLEKQLEENEKSLFPRVVLCLLFGSKGNFEKVEELVGPLMEMEKKDQSTNEPLWCIASQLVAKDKSPSLAAKIMESLDSLESISFGVSGLSADYGPTSLLISALENSGQPERSKKYLVQMISICCIVIAVAGTFDNTRQSNFCSSESDRGIPSTGRTWTRISCSSNAQRK